MSRKTTARSQDRVVRLIRANPDIYLGTHLRPDGDALGTLLGLSLALESEGRRVARLCADPVPENYRFLPGAGAVSAVPPPWNASLGIVVDCDGASRLGRLEPAFAALPHVIDIDHHATDHSFGQERLLDATAAATAEIVYDLLRAMNVHLDADIATCLYTAVLTDSGRFGHGNTTARSLRTAAEFVAAGADPHQISRSIYEEQSVEAAHLLGRALSRLSQDIDSQVVSSLLTRRDFQQTGASANDTEGIIDHLRAIGGPRVALLFVEAEDGAVRVSLRSDGTVDVSDIALGFGGGGHAMASGYTAQGAAERIRRDLLAAVRKALAKASPAHGA